MINEESENKVKDTFHNAISIGEVGQDLLFVNKKLTFFSEIPLISDFPLKNQLFYPPNFRK